MSIVAHPRWTYPVIWLAAPALGGGLGWVLSRAAGWLAALPWVPWQGLFERLTRLPATPTTVTTVAIGVVAGLLFAAAAAAEAPAVEFVAGGAVILRKGSADRVVAGPVRGAYLDDGRLVLLGAGGAELARERTDLGAKALAAGFRSHGAAWYDADPYRAGFRRWVPDVPGLPPGADALLAARDRAVRAGDATDADQLRDELLRLGVAVREERRRQFYRVFTAG